MDICHAKSTTEIATIRELFIEYAQELQIDLCFQNFNQELASLPGQYAAPEGALLLALDHGKAAGCVALRKQAEGICEMKRLYVRPAFRGQRIGRSLVSAIIKAACRANYHLMRLDTLASMKTAIALYHSVGFRPTDPYYHNPLEAPLFLELNLTGFSIERHAHPNQAGELG